MKPKQTTSPTLAELPAEEQLAVLERMVYDALAEIERGTRDPKARLEAIDRALGLLERFRASRAPKVLDVDATLDAMNGWADADRARALHRLGAVQLVADVHRAALAALRAGGIHTAPYEAAVAGLAGVPPADDIEARPAPTVAIDAPRAETQEETRVAVESAPKLEPEAPPVPETPPPPPPPPPTYPEYYPPVAAPFGGIARDWYREVYGQVPTLEEIAAHMDSMNGRTKW